MPAAKLRAVIDTNVLFEGLTKQGGVCGLIVDAWLNEDFSACTSMALEYEYADVLTRKLSPVRWQKLSTVLGLLLDLAEPTRIYYTWRPSASDPGDDFLVDCAMNANALIVTRNVRDFRLASRDLGIQIQTPEQFAATLTAALQASAN
ncbi:MAG TPA: putative toxin-antitoxin system toxin component, PIN family [Blastocatellia bacterium]